jgi:hypothetical protein
MRFLSILLAALALAAEPAAAGCSDCDGDGVERWRDCDDADASIFPGAGETCDGIDNDCDGLVDARPCTTPCDEGLQYCYAGAWQACGARPCCDASVGPGGDYEALCPAATDRAGETLCVGPGVFTAPCPVNADLVGLHGPLTTVIDGDLTAPRGSIWGIRVVGHVAVGELERGGVSVHGSVIEGGLDLRGGDEEPALGTGNRIRGGVIARNRTLLRRNAVEGEGIRASGDSAGPYEWIENRISGAEVAMRLSGIALSAHLERNTIEDCDAGIVYSASLRGAPPALFAGNRIAGCRTGIELRDVVGTPLVARDNIIIGADDHGILVSHGIRFDIGQNLVVGTGDAAPAGAVGIGARGEFGPLVLDHNTVVGRSTGVDLFWYGSDEPGNGIAATGNLVAFNRDGGVLLIDESSDPNVVAGNDVHGNGDDWIAFADPTGLDGNISEDPRFVDRDRGLYGLRPGSPCIDAGTASELPRDLAGRPRTVDGDGDGIAASDIGALEYQPDSPRPLGFWRHQCGRRPFREFDNRQMEDLFSVAEERSPALAECAPIGCAALRSRSGRGAARALAGQELLAAWLNLAAGALSPDSPIDSPDLTGAVSVGGALAEVEATICDAKASWAELEAAQELAAALNSGGDDFDLASDAALLRAGLRFPQPLAVGLINTGGRPRSFDLRAGGEWPIALPITRIDGLPAGEVALVPLLVTVPAWAQPGQEATIEIVATDASTGSVRSHRLVVRLIAGPPGVSAGGRRPANRE